MSLSNADKRPPSPDQVHLHSPWPHLPQRIENNRLATCFRPSTAFHSRFAATKPADIQQYPPGRSGTIERTSPLGDTDEPSTAALKALNINELLEHILLNLDFKDLLLSQRVARRWESVTTGSAKLQQSLFFQPKPAEYSWLFDGRRAVGNLHPDNVDSEGPETLPEGGFVRKVPTNHPWTDSEAVAGTISGLYTLVPSGILHPLFEKANIDILYENNSTARLRRGESNGNSKTQNDDYDDKYNSSNPLVISPSIHLPEASWRKMLFCQPPTNHFRMEWYPDARIYYVSTEDGPQSRELLDDIRKWGKPPCEATRENSLYIEVEGESMWDLNDPAETDSDEEEKDGRDYFRLGTREIVGEGWLTVGEVVDRMVECGGEAFGEGLGIVRAFDCTFPSGKREGKELLWEEEDDWYYRPLAERDERW